MHQPDCIFCAIAEGKVPCHKIYEDEQHLAFLSIFPNTEGFSVVIPKEHYGSYFAQVPETVAVDLLRVARIVASKIDRAYEDVGRTGLMFEGFGVDHLHAKLFPMHGTSSDAWIQHRSKVDKYFTTYEGYISSHDHVRADDTFLASVAKNIRNA